MSKKGVLINAKMGTSVARREIFGAEHIVIEGAGSIIGDSVMNGVYYPLEEVQRLASETTGVIHAPVSHPKDSKGNFISAGSPEGVHQGYVGAISYNYRMHGDRLVRDIAIDPEVANGSDKGREVLRRIEEGIDTDTSTGLLLNMEEVDGIGRDGEEYHSVARNMTLDHDAILTDERGAATTLQGVGMFANAEGDMEELTFGEVTVNASMPTMSLPVAPESHTFNESDAIERIKEFTNSGDKPSSNYRRFFLNFDRDNVDSYDAYEMPFADIVNGQPMAVLSALNTAKQTLGSLDEGDATTANKVIANYEAKSKTQATNAEAEAEVIANGDGKLLSLFKKLASIVAGGDNNVYNQIDKDILSFNTNQQEDDAMRDLILSALKNAGVDTEKLNDSDLLAEYNKLNAPAKKEEEANKDDNDDAVANAVAAAVAPLQAKLDEMESAANAAAEQEKNDLVEKVAGLEIGIDAETAKGMSVNALQNIVTKNTGTVAFNATTSRFKANKANETVEMPSFDA